VTICDICTGRHETHACVIARARIEECLASTPSEPVELPHNVIPLPMFRDEERRAIRHWHRQGRDSDGVRAIRLG
jgi:hypothetical protein